MRGASRVRLRFCVIGPGRLGMKLSRRAERPVTSGSTLEKAICGSSMRQRSISRTRIASLVCWASGALLACSSGTHQDSLEPSGTAAASGGTNPAGNSTADDTSGANAAPNGNSTAAEPGSETNGPSANGAGQNGAAQNGTDEGNVNPVGLQGSGGASAAGSGSGTSNGSAGSAGAPSSMGNAGSAATTNPPPNCDTPPAPSELVGWAAVAGNGVTTTTGGGDATPQVVTTLAALQNAVKGDTPAVIQIRGVLDAGSVQVGSNKTLVGVCGAELHGHLEIRQVQNVIVRNLTIVGYGVGDCALDPDFDATVGCSSGNDAVSVQRNAHHIWFDHDAIHDGTDGNLDITNAANFVTVSWTKFSYTPRTDDVGNDSTGAAGHRFSDLVGSTDSPSTFDDANALNVTWHHNWWADNVVERQPRIRFGHNHLFNNYYNSQTSNYCVRAGKQAGILLEGNLFDGVSDPQQFNSTGDQATANISATATNVYRQTKGEAATGGGGPAFTNPPYTYTLDDANGLAAAVTSGAGPQ
jgi:pectate lyase